MKKPGISNRQTADEEARDRAVHPPLNERPLSGAPTTDDDTPADRRDAAAIDRNVQTAKKGGVRSSAQKAAAAKHGEQPVPAAQPVDGAFGQERPRVRRRNVH